MSAGANSFSCLAVRFSDKSPVLTHLFFRPHKDHSGETGTSALYVTGLPVLQHPLAVVLEKLFSAFGGILSVGVHPSQLSALVVFESERSVAKVVKAAAKDTVIHAPLEPAKGPRGLKSWMLEHKAKFPGNATLKKQLDNWMEDFEKKEEEQAAAKGGDGWTVVTRKPGRRKTTDADNAVAVAGISKAAAEARATKKPIKQLQNFYTHQKQEKRRTQMLNLRQRFEEDKLKIAEMRASRRFKPY